MGGVAGPRLISAVANAGALGVLPIWADSLDSAQSLIKETQRNTKCSFAVNLRADLNQADHISMAADLGIDIFHLFWGDPIASATRISNARGRLIATVGGVDAAKRALDAGVSALVAQSVEAGGHVLSEIPLVDLLADVVAVSGDVPVIAAGGITDPSSARQAIELGASGVLCGSRFVACEESDAHEQYKAAIVQSGRNATVRSICFDLGWSNAPHRTLRNATYEMWEKAGFAEIGDRPGEGDVVLTTEQGDELPRYLVMPPKVGMTGDILAAATYAGTGVDRIDSVLTAREIIEAMAEVLS